MLCCSNVAGYSFIFYAEYLHFPFDIHQGMVTGFISKVQGKKLNMSRAVVKFCGLFRAKNFFKSGNCCLSICAWNIVKVLRLESRNESVDRAQDDSGGSDKSFNLWLSSQAAFPCCDTTDISGCAPDLQSKQQDKKSQGSSAMTSTMVYNPESVHHYPPIKCLSTNTSALFFLNNVPSNFSWFLNSHISYCPVIRAWLTEMPQHEG